MASTCQTHSPDTTTTRVPNSKLRILIHDREEGKICQLEVQSLQQIIVQQEYLGLNRDSLIAVLRRQDTARQRQLNVRDDLLNLAVQQNKVTAQQLGLTKQALRRQTVKTFTVAGIGIGVSLGLTYLLLKK